MFQWLKRKRTKAASIPGIDERGLFWFLSHDGRPHCVDAFVASRKLSELKETEGLDHNEAIKVLSAAAVATASGIESLAADAEAKRAMAFRDLVRASRKAFSLSDSVPNGWTDGEAFSVFSHYLEAVAQVAGEHLPLPKLPA